MEMKKIVVLLGTAIAVLFAAGLVPSAAIPYNDSDNATIDITLNQVTMVDITPEALSWTAEPASIADCDSTKVYCYDPTGVARYGIEIENLGSVNISKIWLNTTFESSYPYASGNPGAYDSANFLAVSTSNSSNRADYKFVNRVEYNATKWPIYLKLPANTVSSGRLRDANYEWFWALVDTDGNGCNATASLYLSNYGDVSGIHNETQNGDIDLADGTPAALAINPLPNDNQYGYVNVTFTTPEGNIPYTLVIDHNCNWVMMNHWNMDLSEMPGTYSEYVWDSSSDGPFTPGNLTEIYAQVRMSYGVHHGSLKTGYLTVVSWDGQ